MSECLFREYLSYAMGIGVVRRESSVGVPLRRLFRYEWMHVSHGDDKPCYREKNKEYVVIPGGMA